MLSTITCVAVACDLCGHDGNSDDEDWIGTPHFADESEALTWLADTGWQITEGSRPTCWRCATAMACVREGHRFTTWTNCMCKPLRSGHEHDQDGCRLQYAWCDRCEHFQVRNRSGITPALANGEVA